MNYRRPKIYIPPYNYCDRACESCAIDKSKCLLYQTEMDEHLHREIDGLGEPTAEETVDRILKDTRLAIGMVEEQAREMGIDLEEAKREAVEAPRGPEELPPIVEEAALLGRGLAEFLRAHGADFPAESVVLRRNLVMPGAKLGRASDPGEDEVEVADSILQAQVVHRMLGGASAALESMRRKRPSLGDAMLDLLRLIQILRREIEARWLSIPCDALEPAPPGEWWGPLRDITPTLKHFRR